MRYQFKNYTIEPFSTFYRTKVNMQLYGRYYSCVEWRMVTIIWDSAWRDIAIHQTALISLRREWDKTALFCSRIHARDARPAGALFLFCALRGLADPASGFRQTSALVASVKNCIHPSTAQRTSSWWHETRRNLSFCRGSPSFAISCNFWRHSANLFSLFFFYRSPVCMFPASILSSSSVSSFRYALLSLVSRVASLFLLTRAVSPFELDHIHHPRQPNLGICWGLHPLTPWPQWLLSTSMKGSLVVDPTRHHFIMYILTCQHSICVICDSPRYICLPSNDVCFWKYTCTWKDCKWNV